MPRWLNRRQAGGLLSIAAAFCLALIIILLGAGTPAVTASPSVPQNLGTSQPAKPAADPSCVTGGVYYYANHVTPAEYGNFGPDPEYYGGLSARDLSTTLSESFCQDPAITEVYYQKIIDPHAGLNRPMSLAEWRREVALLNQRIIWGDSRVVTLTMPTGTQSFGMRPNLNPDKPPTVFPITLPERTSRFLLLAYRTTAHGQVRHLGSRIICRFQPEDAPGTT
jgi:hypothetical protein